MLAKNFQKVIFKCIIKKRLQKFYYFEQGGQKQSPGRLSKISSSNILYVHKHVQTADFTS